MKIPVLEIKECIYCKKIIKININRYTCNKCDDLECIAVDEAIINA